MTPGTASVWELLEQVKDPEIPTVSVVDLGMIREVVPQGSGFVISMTPTYSGCPATKMIEDEICQTLQREGVQAAVQLVYSPPWTTDWITEKGKQAMKESGIAPPIACMKEELVQFPWQKKEVTTVQCPRCDSEKTECKSRFGSTACKALYYCNNCHQPFDLFKPF